jgi:hypothetical protein
MTSLPRSQSTTLFIISLLIIYLVAWPIQSQFLLNTDVSWDMSVTRLMLAGGKYVKDFFEINPPMILFLYSPPVLLAKLSPVSIVLASRLYIYMLSSLSLLACYFFVKNIFALQHYRMRYVVVCALAFIFLILPLYDQGEREHLMIIFTLPYFLAISYRLQNKTLKPIYAFATGIFAGIGFCIKPFYLIAPVLIELYYLFKSRHILAWVRIEIITMMLVLLIYLAAIFIYFPEYIKSVVPYVSLFYYSGYGLPFSRVLCQKIIVFSALISALYFLSAKDNPYKSLLEVFMLALLGFIFAYLMQLTDWYYHYLPVLAMTILLFIILFGQWLAANAGQKYFKLIILIMFFVLSFPALILIQEYKGGLRVTRDHLSLIHALQKFTLPKSTYILTARPDTVYPISDYADIKIKSRFQHLLWIPDSVTVSANGNLSPAKLHAEKVLINMVDEDLLAAKPDLILVDENDFMPMIWFSHFNMLNYFLQDEKFKSIWKNYHYLTSIEARDTDPLTQKILPRWHIFLLPELAFFDNTKNSGNTLLFRINGKHVTAYFFHDHLQFKLHNALLSKNIILSPAEYQFIHSQPAGFLHRTNTNQNIIDSLVTQTFASYGYRFQIYQRNPLNQWVNR